jgi:hypothetical protein
MPGQRLSCHGRHRQCRPFSCLTYCLTCCIIISRVRPSICLYIFCQENRLTPGSLFFCLGLAGHLRQSNSGVTAAATPLVIYWTDSRTHPIWPPVHNTDDKGAEPPVTPFGGDPLSPKRRHRPKEPGWWSMTPCLATSYPKTAVDTIASAPRDARHTTPSGGRSRCLCGR